MHWSLVKYPVYEHNKRRVLDQGKKFLPCGFPTGGKKSTLLADSLSYISTVTVNFISQSGTLLRVKVDSINNYTRAAGVNWDCPRGQNCTCVHPGHRYLEIQFSLNFNAYVSFGEEQNSVYKNASGVTIH